MSSGRCGRLLRPAFPGGDRLRVRPRRGRCRAGEDGQQRVLRQDPAASVSRDDTSVATRRIPQLKKTHTWPTPADRGPIASRRPPLPCGRPSTASPATHVLLRGACSSTSSTPWVTLGPSTGRGARRAARRSAPHLRTLLDSVVALGLLDQCNDLYELNDTARRYLVSDGPACMAELVAVAPGPLPNWSRLADTVRRWATG